MAIRLTSAAFSPGSPIPKQHTGEGADTSPPLAWSGLPAGTKELALVCDDPDAPTPQPWVHWVLYGLSPSLPGLKEGETGVGSSGPTDSGGPGYSGPMPPRGHGVHRYFFKLYALGATLGAKAGLTKEKLLAAMKGHILGEGVLIGTYERR